MGTVDALPNKERMKLKSSLPTEEKNETFNKALTSGDTYLVEELLDSGISVHSRFLYGWTPLMYAASVANVEKILILLDRGANVSFDKEQKYHRPMTKDKRQTNEQRPMTNEQRTMNNEQ
ncbi:Ankyrin repeat, SAM and basic leucine zipper domain-containing protein 1 [Sciurus carolinensis]|uniref:Ankyrin repeat, SAM and basic leucine zipper domain-containing protein 1 n=1 Tax=Sciurus carolinensis TaxID=30640 RepID=A0AA41NB23_SCICA|nr:Ankyrin repeat, SAM and basic leucine zipper domain-containing protein 1 [Sciurus carolinensis]